MKNIVDRFAKWAKRIKWANVICVILIAILIGVCGYNFYVSKVQNHYYEIDYVVENVIENAGGAYEVYFKECSGNGGYYLETNENYSVNESYTLVFNSMNSIDIYDDLIVEIKRPIE